MPPARGGTKSNAKRWRHVPDCGDICSDFWNATRVICVGLGVGRPPAGGPRPGAVPKNRGRPLLPAPGRRYDAGRPPAIAERAIAMNATRPRRRPPPRPGPAAGRRAGRRPVRPARGRQRLRPRQPAGPQVRRQRRHRPARRAGRGRLHRGAADRAGGHGEGRPRAAANARANMRGGAEAAGRGPSRRAARSWSRWLATAPFDGDDDNFFCPSDARPFKDRTHTPGLDQGRVRPAVQDAATGASCPVDACRNDPDRTRAGGIDADTAPPPPQGRWRAA